MDIKLIAMDMDGTLLQSDNTISQRTKEALIKAQKQGVRLVLASGRSYHKLMQYAKELQMDMYGGYLIEVNGIALYDLQKNERTVFHQLHKPDASYIFDFLKQFEVEILGIQDDSIYDYIPESMMDDKRAFRKLHHIDANCPWTAGAFSFIQDCRAGYPNLFTIHEAAELPETLNKFAVAHLPEKLEPVISKIKMGLQDTFWLGLTSSGWLEIMPKDVTKGNALLSLATKLSLVPSQLMAFGDGENDIEMLQVVDYGFVMKNALESVKQYGYGVCDDNQNDGIAKIIETYILS